MEGLFIIVERRYMMNMDLPHCCAGALRTTDLVVEVDAVHQRLRVGDITLAWREVPRGITPESLGALRVRPDEVLLLPYASPRLAAALRDAGMAFVDTAGNAWIHRPPLYVSIEGRRPARRPDRGRPPLLAGGLQVVFALLADPGAVGLPYRDLAGRAGVSLGTVSNTIGWLREQGHLVGAADGLHIVERGRLRERWELGYLEILRKTLLLGQARLAGNATVDTLVTRRAPDVLLGGELAAASLTGRLVPAHATLHVREPLGPVLQALKLVPEPKGPITLLRRFGGADEGHSLGDVRLAHPLLVRAELLASGDARARELADHLGVE